MPRMNSNKFYEQYFFTKTINICVDIMKILKCASL